MLFPWAEAQKSALEYRPQQLGKKADNFALAQFLDLLIVFRRILLQDSAILFVQYPEWSMWNYTPFNLPLFREFSHTSTEIIHAAEEESRANLASIPHNVAESFRGTATTVHLKQEAHHAESKGMIHTLTEPIDVLTAVLAGSRVQRNNLGEFSYLICMCILTYNRIQRSTV